MVGQSVHVLTTGGKTRSLLKRSESYTYADRRETKRRNVMELQRMSQEQVSDQNAWTGPA